jgi:hypothetical protein
MLDSRSLISGGILTFGIVEVLYIYATSHASILISWKIQNLYFKYTVPIVVL